MKLKIHHFIDLNSKEFSVKFFNQRLPFIYILFNFFYRIFIVNLKSKDSEILKFHKSGFTKIDISLKDEINEFKDIKTIVENTPVIGMGEHTPLFLVRKMFQL